MAAGDANADWIDALRDRRYRLETCCRTARSDLGNDGGPIRSPEPIARARMRRCRRRRPARSAIVLARHRFEHDNSKDDRSMGVSLRLLCALAAATMLASCAGGATRDSAQGDIRIVRIEAAAMDPDALSDPNNVPVANECKTWKLRPDQAARFFRLAQEYPTADGQGVGHDFYWLPCSIRGQLTAADGAWDFSINGAATGTWRRGETVRQWGCRDRRCKPLVLLMPDDGEQ
jgi:hypothetical protein